MTITSRYVNIEGAVTILDTAAQIAASFVALPIQSARIQAENEADALFPPTNGTGETELEMFLSQQTNPAYDAYVTERVQVAKVEADKRGAIYYQSDSDGLTSDCASYTGGNIRIEILDEAGFNAYCAARN